MRAALRHLCEKGVEALKPQKVLSKSSLRGTSVRPPEVWRRPVVSKRVANDIRKQAIRAGTYGSFDSETGVGWDPIWDLTLKSRTKSLNRFPGIQPKKKTKRERTREDRAQKIEQNLLTQKEKIEEYHLEKEKLRVQDDSFEARYKRAARSGQN